MKELFLFYIELILFYFVFVFLYQYSKMFNSLSQKYPNNMPKTIIKVNIFTLEYFIRQKVPISSSAFKYLLENDISNLFTNYKKLIPNNTPTYYHTLVPFHVNGLLKSRVNFQDFFLPNNVNIKHFSQFLNHGDKHECEKSEVLLQSLNGPTPVNKYNFTIIYAIAACRASTQLLREIEALSNKEVAFIIFYDNKSNRTVLYELFESKVNNDKFKNVYFIDSPRFYVQWANVITAFPEFVMMQAAIKFFPNSLYISFHSESDYPIVPSKLIVKYLQDNYPKNYIQTLYDRASQWKHSRRRDFKFSFDADFSKKINEVLRYLFPHKIMPDAKWRNGWDYFTMTLNDSRKMIDMFFKRFDLVDALEYCSFGDEIIFDTLVAEADIKSTNEYLRYIDWRTRSAHPLVFNENHFNDIITHRCSFWARKFIMGTSDKVLDMIDEYIKNYSKSELTC